jgi:hypothetical protein
LYTCRIYTKSTCFCRKNTIKTHETLAKQCISCIKYGHIYSCRHVKYTKSTCYCNKNTMKIHENSSKTVHFMFEVFYKCIFVYMWNIPLIHVFAVKTQWKHMKTLANQCISCIKYCTLHVYSCIIVKYTKSTCFYSKKTWKLQQNSTFHV